MSVEVRRVIGRKHCLKCEHPVVVESYDVNRVFDLLKEYVKCHRPIEYDEYGLAVKYCGNQEFTSPRIDIIARKGEK